MTLKEAMKHLITGGWTPPNRMFLKRFYQDEISETRIRSILQKNGYCKVAQEIWEKKGTKHVTKTVPKTA